MVDRFVSSHFILSFSIWRLNWMGTIATRDFSLHTIFLLDFHVRKVEPIAFGFRVVKWPFCASIQCRKISQSIGIWRMFTTKMMMSIMTTIFVGLVNRKRRKQTVMKHMHRIDRQPLVFDIEWQWHWSNVDGRTCAINPFFLRHGRRSHRNILVTAVDQTNKTDKRFD